MAIDLKTWTKDLFNVTGSALAGPAGALIGSLTGGLVSALLPGTSDLFVKVSKRIIPDTLDNSAKALFKRLDPIEKRRINHDLQAALRDALREAIYDLGGERCFPQVWGERPRQVPAGLIYLATPQGEKLWQEQADEVHPHPLAEQVCHFFKEMLNAIAEQRLLPLDPPLDQPAVEGYAFYLEAETPQALTETFFSRVIQPLLRSVGTLLGELPDLEAGLRHDLIDRALFHLGEMLKTHSPAWNAYNRLTLEALRSQVRRIDSPKNEILILLDRLLKSPEMEGVDRTQPAAGRAALAEWTDSLADLLSATGRLEKQASESFEAVLARLGEQQDEALMRFNLLLAAAGRVETEAEDAVRSASGEHPGERVLRFNEDGSYSIEGTSAVAVNEPPAPGSPPFKGLQSFSADDADLFFGREQLIARLVNRMRPISPDQRETLVGGNFLALIGISGCGKTSLVRAGLIPALQRGQPLADGTLPPAGSEHWPVHLITPSEHPLQALADSLTRGRETVTAAQNASGAAAQNASEATVLIKAMQADARSLSQHVRKMLNQGAGERDSREKRAQEQKDRLLLIVDQFEELFTLCREQNERKAFVDNLMAAVDNHPSDEVHPPALVLFILLRADYYARCADYEDLRQAVASRQEYIGPLSAAQNASGAAQNASETADLRRAIEEPTRRGSWELEGGLVRVILHDLGADEWRYSMPALSHALLETWKRRRGRLMTLESYAESGGVHGAIAQTAETAFQQLDASQQALARYIFLQLTVPAPLEEGTQDVCRRTPLSELAPSPEAAGAVEAVLQSLAEAGLITLDQGLAEIAHEALIHAWPALRKWLDERRESLRIHRQLTADAQEWQRLTHDPAAVYRGARLAQALEWAEGHADQFSPLEQEFLEFSKFVVERDAAARAARSEAQRQNKVESARQLAENVKIQRKTEAERRQLDGQAARRQRIRSFLRTSVIALIVLAAILALAYAGTSRQQKVRADRRAETALQNQSAAQAASTQAVAGQITAQAEAQAHATAEADALDQKSAAEAARLEAQYQARISLARELAAYSNSFASRNPDLALLLAAEAVAFSNELGQTLVGEAQTALFNALQTANFAGVLRGHTDEVLSAVFNKDGQYILTTSQDGTARLWNVSSREPVTIREYTGGITSAAFNPDGSHILTTGSDQGQEGVAELWELDGTLVAALTGHIGRVEWGSFSPNGTLIVTAGQDKTARLWKMDGTPLATLTGHTSAVTAAIFSPDRTRLLTLSTDNTARLWTTDGSPVATLTGHTQPILGASFNAGSSRIITASADGTARLWLADGTPAGMLEGHTGEVYSAVFSPNGQRLLTASSDGTARLWRADGSPVMVLGWSLSASDGLYPPTPGGLSSLKPMAIFNPAGTLILTAGGDSSPRLWRTDGILLAILTGHTNTVYCARFSDDGQQIVTASADRTARVWEIDRLYVATLAHNTLGVTWAGFSPDGKLVLTAGLDGVARLYRTDGVQKAAFTGHTGGLTNASFSPDGQLIATASRDGTARVWRTDGTSLAELRGHTGPMRSANFSPDNKLVVTASQDGTARLYRVSGSLVLDLKGHTDEVWSAFFSPDGNRIVTASQDGTARIWSIDGQLLHTIDNNNVPVNMAAFSPDGQMVITAGQDGGARLWLTDGTPFASLEGHADMVNWAAFSADGKLIATASNDGTARLWTMDGKFLASVESHTHWVTSTGFSPDGLYLVTASQDGTVRLWSTFENLEAMLAEADQRVGRWLTETECQRYLHLETCPSNP